MDLNLKKEFLEKWAKYFVKAELPIIFYYSKDRTDVPLAEPHGGWSCIICELASVRKGESLAYQEDNLLCGGSKRYLGYTQKMRSNFEYFLSCGIPGKMKGERYIRTPEMVKEIIKNTPVMARNDEYIIFKRWDKLEEKDVPVSIIFFATPDVLSGLFTLANFDQVEGNGVIAPFGSGCSSVIYRANQENEKENPRAVLGMFDPSARPYVPKDTLTISIPMKKFVKMVGYMDESFLITETWETIKKRI